MNSFYEQVRQLYLEKLAGTITEDEERILDDLLEQSSEARKIWSLLEKQGTLLDADRIMGEVNPEKALNRFKKRYQSPSFNQPRYARYRWAAAAVFALGLAMAYYYVWQNNPEYGSLNVKSFKPASNIDKTGKTIILSIGDKKIRQFSEGMTENFSFHDYQFSNTGNELVIEQTGSTSDASLKLFVPTKSDYTVLLPDGSRVSLNSDTELSLTRKFTTSNRRVSIKGEAYFEVNSNPGSPFVVQTLLHDIKVTGTRFNVNTYEDGVIRTALLEGKVSVMKEGIPTLALSEGMESGFTEKDGFTFRAFDEVEVLSWREGIYYFHETPLKELSGILSRWFNVTLEFEKGDLSEYRVSGMVEKGHLHEFLDDLRATSSIIHELSDSTITLGRSNH